MVNTCVPNEEPSFADAARDNANTIEFERTAQNNEYNRKTGILCVK